jgi:hypothetical protein
MQGVEPAAAAAAHEAEAAAGPAQGGSGQRKVQVSKHATPWATAAKEGQAHPLGDTSGCLQGHVPWVMPLPWLLKPPQWR